jgi:hypothetical protein
MNHIDRMLDERSELVIKRAKLHEFIAHSLTWKALGDQERELMISQRYVMGLYIDLLTKRIELATSRG